MKILIEEEWQANDIIEYCKEKNLNYRILSYDEIANLSADEFFEGPFFCNTNIVQKNLFIKNIPEKIPDTYPDFLNNLYKRSIKKITFGDINKLKYPYFIKSTKNNKKISGSTIKNSTEQDNLWTINNISPTKDLELYVSEIVGFYVEYRLLIGNNKIYGTGFQQGNNKIDPDIDFIKNILELCGDHFYCIDIGYLGAKKGWAIVEVNPPFSLDDYNIPLDNYMEYCIDFWKSLNV